MNDKGYKNTLFHSIIGHEYEPPFTDAMQDENFDSKSKSTEGWKICLQWKDGSSSWHPMIDVKNSFPVQLADYALFHKLQDKAGFSWWIKHTLKKRERMIKVLFPQGTQNIHINLEFKCQ